MIGIFLDPYPEEILYSTLARNAAALNYPNLRSVGVTYLGDPHAIATVALPCRLEYLVTHLPPNAVHIADTLIDEHTLLPLFAPFLPPTRVAQLRSDMSGAQGMGVHMRAGLMASTVPLPDALQFCPACAAEDKKLYDEGFWHRQHQVPGVHLCSKHRVWLETSSVLLTQRQTRHAYITAENAIPCLPPPRTLLNTPREAGLLAIAQSMEWLLVERISPPGLEHIRDRYVRKLVKLDLATFAGRVRISEVLEAFLAFYTEEFLDFLHCHLDPQSQDHWLTRLIRKPDSALHPVQHLLLMHFLGGTISDYFLDQAGPPAPFGSGPWPCLNPVCPYYNTSVIRICTITYPPGLNGRPSGSFACTCGFIYGRTGPDAGRDDMYRRGKIIAVGQVWESTLREYWNDVSLSVNRIAERLGVDPRTVKLHAQRLGLSMVRINKKKALAVSPQRVSRVAFGAGVAQSDLYPMRIAWQKACKVHGHRGRKYVRQQIPRVYTWLYRHDRDWLEQHLPPRKRPKPGQRVDWSARDTKIAQLIPAAVQQLRSRPGPPRQLTIAAIGRAIGYEAMIQQHLDLLPLTAAALAEGEESRTAFANRRIQWASRHFYNRGGVLKRWKLARLSGVERLLSDVEIQKTLDLAVNEMKQLFELH
jgi:hypothetical protein